MILLLSVVAGVFGASVAVDVVDSFAKHDNVTNVDNSTKSLNVSESISALKIRDVDVILIISHSLFTIPIMFVWPFFID